MLLVHFQGKPEITVIQVYTPTSNAEEADIEWFYEDRQDLLDPTPKKICPFHHRGLECKRRKSRNTWTNRCKMKHRAYEFCQENTQVIANTHFQQHKS